MQRRLQSVLVRSSSRLGGRHVHGALSEGELWPVVVVEHEADQYDATVNKNHQLATNHGLQLWPIA